MRNRERRTSVYTCLNIISSKAGHDRIKESYTHTHTYLDRNQTGESNAVSSQFLKSQQSPQ